MQELTKDIDIGQSTYQIGSLTADTASWIVFQLLPKIAGALKNVPSEESGSLMEMVSMLGAKIAETDEETFKRIQRHGLSVCRRYENGMPMPVFVPPNLWAAKDLQYDLMTVMTLTVQSVWFNISGFFSGGGLTAVLGNLPDTTQQNTQL